MRPRLRNFFVALAEPFRRAIARIRGRSGTPAERTKTLDQELVFRVQRPRRLPSLTQLSYLPRVLPRWERITLALAAVVAIGAAGVLLWNTFAKYRTLVPQPGGEYIEAVVGAPQLINPLWATANDVDRDFVRLIFSGLFTYNANLEPVTDLAENYEVSEDGKTYTVKLRPGLSWHDGEPLTSSDVVFTVSSIQNPVMKSPLAPDFRGVTASANDPQTIVFTLEAPSALFLHALTTGIIPEHLWADVPPENARLAEFNLKPVGAGPFRFKTLRKNKLGALHSYTLERNAAYHGPKPYLKTIVIKFFPDYRTAIDALARGNADGLAFAPFELRGDLTRKRDLVYHRLDLPQITAVFLNQKRNAIIAQKAVREALAHALDREALIREAFHDDGTPIIGPILPGFSGYTADVPGREYNLDRARELLDGEGWKVAEGKEVRTFVPRDRNDKRFVKDTALHIELVTVNVPEYVRAAELIRDAWIAIGVEVALTVVEPNATLRDVLAGRAYDALLYGEIIGPDPDPFPFWHSSQIAAPGVNLAQYANRRVDALLEEARTLRDANERAIRYDEFQKTVVGELPAIFLLSPSYTYAMHERVRGVEFGRLGAPADRFARINEWYVKTKTKLW